MGCAVVVVYYLPIGKYTYIMHHISFLMILTRVGSVLVLVLEYLYLQVLFPVLVLGLKYIFKMVKVLVLGLKYI